MVGVQFSDRCVVGMHWKQECCGCRPRAPYCVGEWEKGEWGVINRSSVFCFCFFFPSHSLGPFLRVWRVGDVYDTGTVSQTGTHSKKVCYDIGIIPWDIMRLECIIEGVGNDSEVCCGSVGGCAPVMCSNGYGNFAKEGGDEMRC